MSKPNERPYWPAIWRSAPARAHLGEAVFHAAHYGLRAPDLRGKRVAVIGGGQSGAEVVYHALSDARALPERLLWVSQRDGFRPLDDSPFADEWFTPEYSEHFRDLDPARRAELVSGQALASDGITMGSCIFGPAAGNRNQLRRLVAPPNNDSSIPRDLDTPRRRARRACQIRGLA